MKNILVPIEIHSSIDSVLATALLLGKRFGAIIEGVSLGPDLPDFVAFDLPMSWTVTDQANWRDLIEEGHHRFENFMNDCGVPPRDAAAGSGLAYGWSERSLSDGHIGNYARIFDLCVIGRPGTEHGDARMATLEGALFDSGRPVVLAPPEAPGQLGDTIVIAWTRSIESARTTALARPLLARAKRVVLLTIAEQGIEDLLARQMAGNLQANGIAAEAVTRRGKGKVLGEAWLEEAAALGADLLIKGGYTRSRLRHLIFGDATRHILAHAELPVLMAS